MKMKDYIFQAHQVALENIENQDKLVASLVDQYRMRQPETLWIVASGSSYNSSLCALPFLQKYLPSHVKLIPPYSFAAYDYQFVKEEDLVVVVSQSGYSTNAIEALDILKEKNMYRIGITGNVNSDIKHHCDLVVDYGSQIEDVHFVTQGVTTMVVFWYLFGLKVANLSEEEYEQQLNEIKDILNKHPEIIEKADRFIDRHFINLLRTQIAYFAGSGSNFGTATEGALKFSETVLVPCLALETEEYIHGHNLQLSPEYSVFLLGNGDHTNQRICTIFEGTREVTNDVYLFTSESCGLEDDRILVLPKHPELYNPLVFLPVVQTLTSRVYSYLGRKQHPLLAKFKDIAKSKTENYVDDNEGSVVVKNV